MEGRERVRLVLLVAVLGVKDSLEVVVEGFEEGGAIEGRPFMLKRDFALESEVRLVVAGVPVRGVEAAELAEDRAVLVGDFVGD